MRHGLDRMSEEYTFQPQINSRSRRLARHAPTLRERQAQDEVQRRNLASGDSPAPRSPQSAQRNATRPTPAAAAPHASSEDAVESVWALWRAVAVGEGRKEEEAFVRQPSLSATAAKQPRPPVVHVTTIMSMLSSLGIRAPQHTALIDKFLLAVGGVAQDEGGDGDDEAARVVDGERFAHVFSTVWRAAVTNRTRWSPAPARAASLSPAPPPAAAAAAAATAATAAASTWTQPVTRPASSSSNSSAASAVREDDDASASRTSTSSSAYVSSASTSSSGPSTPLLDHTDSESSGSAEKESDDDDTVSSENGSFLHTNMSRTSTPPSPAPPPRSAIQDTKPTSPSLPSAEGAGEMAGLSESPEPRNPHVSRLLPNAAHRPSPFSPASASMLRRERASSSTTRVLPNDSHLLTSTTSCERKKAAKRVPGGLMRECTFAPQINAVGSRAARATAGAAAPFQTDSREQPLEQSVCTAGGELQRPIERRERAPVSQGASPVPLAPGFDTAVRRMIAARQMQRHSVSTSTTRATAPATAAIERRASAVRPAQQPRSRSNPAPQPLLYVDVDLPHGETGRIALFRDANVCAVAEAFSAQHNLDDRLRRRLENVLWEQLKAYS